MEPEKDKINVNFECKEHQRRLDFYWQYLSVYSFALLVYVLMKGTIIDDTIRLTLYDPVVMLLTSFVIFIAFSLIIQAYKKKSIIIGNDYIILKTRFKEKKYYLDSIRKISISKDRRIRIRGAPRMIKFWLNNRKLAIKIRPTAFSQDKKLVKSIINLRSKLKHR